MNNRKQQKGFTLLELMTAATLGIFILGGLITVYVGMKRADEKRELISRMDESARIALTSMSEHLGRAGYSAFTQGRPIENYVLPTKFRMPFGVCPVGPGPGLSLRITPEVVNVTAIPDSADGSSSDKVAIRFAADASGFQDCAGGIIPSNCRSTAAMPHFIYNGYSVDKKEATLYCHGSRNNAKVPISDGVEMMQVAYGVDTDGDQSVNGYWPASTVNAQSMWGNILAIQVTLLIRSQREFYDAAQSERFAVGERIVNVNDRYRRVVYKKTIRLLNSGVLL